MMTEEVTGVIQKPKRKEIIAEINPVFPADLRVPSIPFPSPVGVCGRGLALPNTEKFYLTTAINYTNGWPHMGHTYEAVVSDIIARQRRLYGESVLFCTGTDEHGQKIAEAAEKSSLAPIDLCTKYKNGFVALNERLEISNDWYIRTTDEYHKKTAQELWRKCETSDDIYKADYEGYYLVREERYVTDQEATEWNFVDPVSGNPLTKMKEESYFFRLSKYHEFVLAKIREDESFVYPAQYRAEILGRLEKEPLKDLSISRSSFNWGIPVKNDAKHVMYVWFDALTNYYSAAVEHGNGMWPASAHVIGKDIVWFHAVIWPCMLQSAGIPLPKQILVHGFVLDKEGRKMSKSIGNVIDAHDILNKFPAESLRWYIASETPFGGDLRFSEEALRNAHNAELCDKLGNLVARLVALAQGAVPQADLCQEKPFDMELLVNKYREAFGRFALHEGAELARQATVAINEFLTRRAPWKCQDPVEKAQIVRTALEYLFIVAHFWAPIVPIAAERIFHKFNTSPVLPVTALKHTGNLVSGSPLASDAADTVLFKPIFAAQPEQVVVKTPAPKLDDMPEFDRIDLRIARITSASNHPTADRLFVESMDLKEAAPRTIVSGLREHYEIPDLKNKLVVVVANLKPRKIQGVESNGMVLCAKSNDTVELIAVQIEAEDSEDFVGCRVDYSGHSVPLVAALDAKIADKTKAWDAIAPKLATDSDGYACYDGKRLTVNGKLLKSSLTNAPIS